MHQRQSQSGSPNSPNKRGFLAAFKIGLVGAVIGAAVSLFIPNYYRSQATFLPLESKNTAALGQIMAAAASLGAGIGGNESADSNFVDILRSRAILGDLAQTNFKFTMRTWRFGAIRPKQETLGEYLGAKNLDRAIVKMPNIFSVTRDQKTKIITLAAETKSPGLSQAILGKAINDLEDFLQHKTHTRGGEKARFAQARLDDAKKDVLEAEATFRNYLERNRNYQSSADPSVRLTVARLEADLKLREQLVLTLAMNREQALLEEKNDMPIVNVLDHPNLPIEKSWPNRSLLTLLSFMFSLGAAWLWIYRDWILAMLREGEGRESN